MSAAAAETGTIVLRDGAEIAYRPISASDQAALQRFHAKLSDRSIHQRFFCAMPALGDAQAHDFTHVDGVDRFALVALDPAAPAEIVAVVRFDRDRGGDRAECAGIVADQWQGRGLGTALTRRLVEAAARGVRRFDAIVLPDNAQMLGLLRDLALPEQIVHDGMVERVEVGLLAATSSLDGVPAILPPFR
jgi:RimJ/RimL family protein N-acetyltransferase